MESQINYLPLLELRHPSQAAIPTTATVATATAPMTVAETPLSERSMEGEAALSVRGALREARMEPEEEEEEDDKALLPEEGAEARLEERREADLLGAMVG